MRVLKNILIGLGVIFLVALAFFAWIGVSGSQFRKEQAPFVEAFVTDLSKRWDIADVYDRLANPLSNRPALRKQSNCCSSSSSWAR